ncbi:MAG TPA: exo-alpha-sialidase [Ignavibacteria bacterium]
MKKAITVLLATFVLLICNLTFNIENGLSQWQADVRMTNDPQLSFTSFGNARCVAANGDVVHVVWYSGDTVGVNGWDIFYKRSTDKGSTWSTAVNLSNNGLISYNPAIAVSGSDVHVVWFGNGDGNYEEYYIRSTDGGITWEPKVRLTNALNSSAHGSIAASGSNVHFVWMDYRNGKCEVFYKKSVDAGVNWSEDLLLNNSGVKSYMPAVAVSGSVVHVVWADSIAGNWEIYYKRSVDGGITWGADTRLTNNSAVSNYPTLAVSGSTVHIVWTDNRNKTVTLFYKRSTNGGVTWGSDVEIFKKGPNYSRQFPSIAVEGSNVHVVYSQFVIGGPEIYYVSSVNAGVNWGSDVRLTNSADYSYIPSIAVLNGNINVLWRDYRDGNWEIYYKRYINSPKNNLTRTTNMNTGTPDKFSLSQNYPNPFNPVTNINFDIPKQGFVNLKIYDLLGREIQSLVNENLCAGSYSVNWDASPFSSGTYIYRIETQGFAEVKRMLLIK